MAYRWELSAQVRSRSGLAVAGAYGGLLLSAVLAGDICRQWLAPGVQQQQRRSTALLLQMRAVACRQSS